MTVRAASTQKPLRLCPCFLAYSSIRASTKRWTVMLIFSAGPRYFSTGTSTTAHIARTAWGKPCVSTAMWRLMPETFLPASIALERRRVRALHALHVQNQEHQTSAAPQFFSGHASLTFLKPAPSHLGLGLPARSTQREVLSLPKIGNAARRHSI